GNAITDRAPIEDPATIGALPVNHLGYRIHRPYVVEEIVIGVATYITAHNRVHKAPHSERCDLLGGLAGSHCPGLDGRCCPVWGAEAFVQPYMLKRRDPYIRLVPDRILCEGFIRSGSGALEQKMVGIGDRKCAKGYIACRRSRRGGAATKAQNP